MPQASVMKSGNSAVVALPSAFRKRNGIEVGDHVEIAYPAEDTMVIRPVGAAAASRRAALEQLLALVQQQDGSQGPTPYRDGREGIRDVLEGRYV